MKIFGKNSLAVCATLFALAFGSQALSDTICPKNSSDKWLKTGHGHTTSIVGTLAGHDPRKAQRLAYFSQAPDELWLKYSAPAVSLWGWFPGNMKHRKRVFRILHSLHGGNASEVTARQKLLSGITRSFMVNEREDWELGFIIHAFGDSFAHTFPLNDDNSDVRAAYGPPFGHGLELSGHPDKIFSETIDVYKNYVAALFTAIATDDADQTALDRYLAGIDDILARTSNDRRAKDAVEDYISTFRINGRLATSLTRAECKAWRKTMRRKKVRSLLKEMEVAINRG